MSAGKEKTSNRRKHKGTERCAPMLFVIVQRRNKKGLSGMSYSAVRRLWQNCHGKASTSVYKISVIPFSKLTITHISPDWRGDMGNSYRHRKLKIYIF